MVLLDIWHSWNKPNPRPHGQPVPKIYTYSTPRSVHKFSSAKVLQVSGGRTRQSLSERLISKPDCNSSWRSGLFWLKTGTGNGRFWIWQWIFGCNKLSGISWLAEESFSRRTLLHGGHQTSPDTSETVHRHTPHKLLKTFKNVYSTVILHKLKLVTGVSLWKLYSEMYSRNWQCSIWWVFATIWKELLDFQVI